MPIYMNYDGIQGDVTESGHTKWIEIYSFQFGVGRGISMPVGRGAERESSAPSVSEITVAHNHDIASIKLLDAAYRGEGKTVKIDFCRTEKAKLQVYAQYELTNTLISGWSQSSGGDRPNESISLNFTKIMFTATPMNPDGSPGNSSSVTYDLGTAVTS